MLGQFAKTADWKSEKHVPAIVAPEEVRAGAIFEIEVSVGREIPHPNTFEHHIAWISLYFVAEGTQLPVEISRAEFPAHGEVLSSPTLKASVALPKSGTLHAVSYCNIHGLWESSAAITVK